MNERTFRRVFAQFLNDYWGAFHEALEAQSVNPKMLAGSLFDDMIAAHRRFVGLGDGFGSPVDRLDGLWRHVTERRDTTRDAPLSAREVAHARAQFEAIHDGLAARGTLFPLAARKVHTAAGMVRRAHHFGLIRRRDELTARSRRSAISNRHRTWNKGSRPIAHRFSLRLMGSLSPFALRARTRTKCGRAAPPRSAPSTRPPPRDGSPDLIAGRAVDDALMAYSCSMRWAVKNDPFNAIAARMISRKRSRC